MWNGLSLRLCHGHGIDWSNWIVDVVLLIGYWKDGNQLMIATNKKSVISKGMNDAEVSVKKSTSLVTIFGDDDSHSEINWHRLMTVVWYYPTPSDGWGRGGTPRRPNSRATPQGLDHRSRIEREEPKIDLRRGSEARQSRRR